MILHQPVHSTPPAGADAAFAGKIALVTGGAGGVGTVIVERLARAGAHVIINCFHSYAKAKALSARLAEEGCSTEVARASVAKRDAVEQMMDALIARHGRLDIVVNNAAGGRFVPFDDLAEELLDRTFATNVKGALWVTKAAAGHLPRGGRVVNVSSIGASGVPDNYLAVGVSKAALEALTRYLAVELAPRGINVNTASCALIDNEVGRLFPAADSMFAESLRATPMGRIATPEDLAEVVLFLASPAAQWITGQCVLADGGLSLLNQALSPSKAPLPDVVACESPAAAASSSAAEIPADALAIVGMGIAVPGASSPQEYWQRLLDGGEFFIEAPADRWPVENSHHPDHSAPDKSYQRRSGFITDFTPHPALAAELGEGAGADWDHTTLWLRHSLFQALEGVHRPAGTRHTFCVGYTPDGSQHLQESLVLRSALHAAEQVGLAEAEHDAVTRQLAGRYWRGAGAAEGFLPHRAVAAAAEGILPASTPSHVLDTACSSSLYAIDHGARDLLAGNADIAVCGGSFALAASGSVLFSKLNGLSKRGVVASLDSSADGVLFCDGAGIVVLKRLADAVRDGDRILGQLSGVGLSADGKGKAIYAPSSAGQALAVRRCFERSALDPADVDWIIAHATGTPAGDLAEFKGLAEVYAGNRPVQVTSNKSLIGHAGWAAGVASVINALLGLQHDRIPAQFRYQTPPSDFQLDETNLQIPAAPLDWPRGTRPRTVAVSGFGFGGTNAHLLISDYQPGTPLPSGYGAAGQDDLVVVGWSAQLPGTQDAAQVMNLLESSDGWGGFGDTYPAPGFPRLKMPPGTVRTTDRTQVSIVEAMQRLPQEVFDFCQHRRDRTGVVVGHLGMTRNALLFGLRAHVDDLHDVLGGSPGGTRVADRFAERARGLASPPTEDSFPGEMPNVIAARLSNYFDLKGLNITVDNGRASLHEALQVAQGYLRFGDLEAAVVATSDGNTDPAWLELVAQSTTGRADGGTQEGTFLFVTTLRRTAEAAGLPILATLGQPTCAGAEPGVHASPEALATAGSRELARFLTDDSASQAAIGLRADHGAQPVRIHATKDTRAQAVPAASSADPASDLPDRPGNLRHLFGLADLEPVAGDPLPPLPAEAFLVTNLQAAALDTLARCARAHGARLVSVEQWDDLAEDLSGAGQPVADLRFVLDLGPAPAPADTPAAAAGWARLSDVVFRCSQLWARSQTATSWGLVLLGGTDAALCPHPGAGLFTGFAKSLLLELPEREVRSVVSSTGDPLLGLAELAVELAQPAALPVIYRVGPRRATIAVHRAPAQPPGPALAADDLIVAAGGARGVAAALLLAAAERYRCRIALIGTLDLAEIPADILQQSEVQFSAGKADYIRQRLQGSRAGLRGQRPVGGVAEANREYVRLGQAREVAATLRQLRDLLGADRVHYLRADLRDATSTRDVVAQIEREHGPTAVLLNVAGINRASSVAEKTMTDFTAVAISSCALTTT